MRKTFWQQQIPTLLGIGVLITALIVGVIVFTIGGGAGVFAPRAAPETTPKKIKVTNVTDTGFTVSFYTDSKTAGFVRYGTDAGNIKSQASDDRDQLSGSVGQYNLHHITVRGLNPNTTYHYLLGTSARSTFDNNGAAFTIKTAQRAGAPSAAKTAYGNVVTASGSPAEGAIVYLSITGAGEMSSLVKNSGSWAVPLSNARKSDGTGYAQITDGDSLNISAQGEQENLTSTLSVSVKDSQPVANITLGQNGATAATTRTDTVADTSAAASLPALGETSTTGTATSDVPFSASSTSSATLETLGGTGGLSGMLSSTATGSSEVNVDVKTPESINTTQPIITGSAAANATVKIEVHSDAAITQTVTAGSDGSYELNLEDLESELEPGEHTVTVTYTDPATGKAVTKTKTFTVQASAAAGSQIALATTAQPFGSGNPVPVGGTSTSSATAVSTSSATTKGATTSSTARTSLPATTSAIPVSGSVGTTMMMVIGGLFFLIAGGWSFWVAQQLSEDNTNVAKTDLV